MIHGARILTVTVKAKQSTRQKPNIPVGSVYFDDLIQRYLVGIGLREFEFLTRQEITQFALLSIFRVTQRYELIGANKENFWASVMPDRKEAHVCLLPDTTEGQDFFRTSGEFTILFKEVENVTALMRK